MYNGVLGPEIRSQCETILTRNWHEGIRRTDGVPFAYTRPSPGHYPWQWYWDSCFTAIAWRHLDPGRSRRELESLLAAQRQDGFIGHTIFWNTPLRGLRRYTYNVTSPTATMTASIQPPALAWAWRIAVGDPVEEPRIAAQFDWLRRHRDLDGDGLIWILQPDESGLDASPQFDVIWGGRAHARPGYLGLVRRNRRLGFDLRKALDAGGPVCCEVTTNVLHALSLMALGRPSSTPAIVERLYDERRGLFVPLAQPQPDKAPAVTWSALAPLALPDLPEEIGRRLVEEHLLDETKFWLPVAPPSVSAAEPTFSRRDAGLLRIRRYWRGPTWINSAWLLWLGLIRLGYDRPAATLVERVATAIGPAGLREYYDPYSGRGMGAVDFAWSSLVLDMLDPDPRVASSYLGDPDPIPAT
jgi:Mannosylglycerate hydrolase MGH1-like glycoside hydrolase domain